jgi:hypothetical protein
MRRNVVSKESARRTVSCPHCNKEHVTFRVDAEDPACDACSEFTVPERVLFSSDVDWQEGRTGDKFWHPGLGKVISTRRDIEDGHKYARDEQFSRTDGEHTTWITDPATGEKHPHTTRSEGIDMGELYTPMSYEKFEEPDLKNLALKKAEREIAESLKGVDVAEEMRKHG